MMTLAKNPQLIRTTGLVKFYPIRSGMFSGTKGYVHAVEGVDFEVIEGENHGLVGESGCGKTTLGRMLCGLTKPTSGSIRFLETSLSGKRKFASYIQPVFQDPFSSLNPTKRLRAILSLPFRTNGISYDEGVLVELLEQVHLSPGKSFLDRFPHELSGGQRQRVAIARALALKPKLVIADEPVSGLDVTVQEQILELLNELQKAFKTTYVVISHDIRFVKNLCQRISIMYLGKIIETGPTEAVVTNPFHPYTVSLLKSFPSGNPNKREWILNPPITGQVPSATNPPSGCRFRTRCSLAIDQCSRTEPSLQSCGPEHFVACPVILGQNPKPN